jgi:hypothetical protein
MERFIQALFSDPEMLRMGHQQRAEDLNLGLGWLYYALGRIIRPERAVVIGSFRGFTPRVIGKALADNLEGGEVLFIDPSLADGFWADAASVDQYFHDQGVDNVRHFCGTTQEYVKSEAYHNLTGIGLLMVDGYNTADQARFDYLAFLDKLTESAVVLFHDSIVPKQSKFYGDDKAYRHNVYCLMDRLRKTPGLEVLNLPFGAGLTLVRGRPDSLDGLYAPFEAIE